MITIKNNKVYLNKEDLRIVTQIYAAFKPDIEYCSVLLKLATTEEYKKREPEFNTIVINAPCCLDAACKFIMQAVNENINYELVEEA